jgi:hypothetical protein
MEFMASELGDPRFPRYRAFVQASSEVEAVSMLMGAGAAPLAARRPEGARPAAGSEARHDGGLGRPAGEGTRRPAQWSPISPQI